MNIDDNTYELIEKYLGGVMSEEQKVVFEKRISEDTVLADQVNIFRLMPGYLQDDSFPVSDYESDHPKAKAYLDEYLKEETKALKDHLSERGEEVENASSTNSRMGVWQVMRVAAVLLVLVAAATFLFRPSESERLYAKYTQHEELSLNIRGASDELKQKAEQQYNAGHFYKALPLLEELDALNSDDYNMLLALGITRLETGQTDAAITTFNTIYRSDAIIRDAALYYRAMALIKSDDTVAALEMLHRVQNEFPDYEPETVKALIQRLAKKNS